MKSLVLLFVLLISANGLLAQQSRSDRAVLEKGEEVYLKVGCDACHGTVGHGGAAPKLAPQPLPYPAFEYWVRNGTPGWGIIVGMPAFHHGVLSDEQLQAVHVYLASQPDSRAVEDIRLLRD